MTLGELKKELLKSKIRSIGTLRKLPTDNGKDYVVVYFTSDQNAVIPFRIKNVYPLVVKTGLDTDRVHGEKVRALKRAFDI